MEHREYLRAAVRQGWLVKQGGHYKSWKKRWVSLSSSVIYYFEDPKEVRGGSSALRPRRTHQSTRLHVSPANQARCV